MHLRRLIAALTLSAAAVASQPARADAGIAPASLCKGHSNDVWTSWWSGGNNWFEVEFGNCSGFGSDHVKVILPWASDSPCWWFHGSASGTYHVKFYPSNAIRHATGTATRCGSSDGSPATLYRWQPPGGGGGGGGWKL